MTSLREARDDIFRSYDQGLISDEEFLLLFKHQNLDLPFDLYTAFHLGSG